MAAFPALVPSSRTRTPGVYATTPFRSLAGAEQRVRHSNRRHGDELRLGFRAITETQLHLIVDHYQGQKGSRLSFALSNEVLSGIPSPGSYTPTGHSWIYLEPPNADDFTTGYHNVEVRLALVPEVAA